MEYTYSASGEKLEKLRKSSLTNTYIGNFVYKGDGSLDYIITPEGRLVNVSGNLVYEYYLKDHLGNTRNTFQIVSNTVVQKQKMDYYPFGMQLDKAFASHDNKYLYNGKELQDDQFDNGMKLDWLDYGARMYDASLGRWHTQDPLAEGFSTLTPYHYVKNNPIRLFDPNGMADNESFAEWTKRNQDEDKETNDDHNERFSSINSGSSALENLIATTSEEGEEEEKKKEASNEGDRYLKDPSRIDLFMNVIMFPVDFIGAAFDFKRNYQDMRNLNLINSDKYFHSKANFEASQRGYGGELFAIHFSNLREIFDQRIKGDSYWESVQDQKANLYGREQGLYYRYYHEPINFVNTIPKYRKKYFPNGY